MVGEPRSTWAKRVPGSLWEIEMQVNLTASFLPAAQYPKHLPACLSSSLPPSLPQYRSDSAALPVTVLQAHQLFLFPKALRGFAF